MIRIRKKQWILWGGAAAAVLLLAVALWNWEKLFSPTSWFVDERNYDAEIAAAAERHGLDPDLVRALIYQESRFKAHRRGGRGEIGLMQILPSGAVAEWARVNKRRRPLAVELFDVDLNLEIGCWYLARAMKRWKNYDRRSELALAEYNAGASRAREWAPPRRDGEVISRIKIASTKKYVTEIMKRYRSYSKKTSEAKNKPSPVGKK